MPSTKRLNSLPNSIGQSYLSTLKYYKKGYMADCLNSVAIKTQEFNISIDILKDEIIPKICQIRSLLVWNEEYEF